MSKADPLNYGKTNANYWQEMYGPGLFDKLQGATKHKSLAQPTPRKAPPKPLPLRAPERAGDVIVIPLPLPARVLHKNGRTKNYKWKASVTKAARNAAMSLTSLVRPAEQWQSVRMDATLWIANRNDDDGVWAWLAAYRDGIALALGLNDRHFTAGNVTQHTGVTSGGRREVEITVTRLA
jgi:hypothetical protein